MRGPSPHETLAGAIGGASVVGGAWAGPLWGVALDMGAAAASAAIAAHAVHGVAKEHGLDGRALLHRAARAEAKRPKGHVAAHAVDFACRASAGDSRALRSAAMLVGRCTSAHAGGLVMQALGKWLEPARKLATLGAPGQAARQAKAHGDFVRGMTERALARAATVGVAGECGVDVEVAFEVEGAFGVGGLEDEAPVSRELPLVTFAGGWDRIDEEEEAA